MKKISAVLLIAVLASGLVFAGFSGSAAMGFGYNLDSKAYGFMDDAQKVNIDVALFEALGEAKGEGDIYAEIKGSLSITFNTNGDEKTSITNPDPAVTGGSDKLKDGFASQVIVKAKIDSAKIIGKDWYVGILSAPDAANFAKSAIDSKDVAQDPNALGYESDDETKYADFKVIEMIKASGSKPMGIEAGYAGYVVGAGLVGDAGAKTYNVYGTITTPDYEVADGVVVATGLTGSFANTGKVFGGSVKVAYTADAFKASVASDLGYDGEFGADVALNIAYAPVTLDAYYATKSNKDVFLTVDNLLSAKVVTDLNEFDVPVKLTVTGKDLINAQDLSAEVAISVADGLTITPAGGYKISTETWNAGASVEYKADAFTAKVGGKYYSTEQLKLNASVESTALVPGATLKLAYAGDDVLNKLAPADQTDLDNGVLGKVVASCKIAF